VLAAIAHHEICAEARLGSAVMIVRGVEANARPFEAGMHHLPRISPPSRPEPHIAVAHITVTLPSRSFHENASASHSTS